MANFADFTLISCGNGPQWTKTKQTQTPFSLLQNIFWGIHTSLESRQNFYDTPGQIPKLILTLRPISTFTGCSRNIVEYVW